MTRITNTRWAGSVMWLTARHRYEVRAVINDPDGGGRHRHRAHAPRRLPSTVRDARGGWRRTATTRTPAPQDRAARDPPGRGRQSPGRRPDPRAARASTTRPSTPRARHVVGADPPRRRRPGRGPRRLRPGATLRAPTGRTTAAACTASRSRGPRGSCAPTACMRLYRHASLAAPQTQRNGMTQGWVDRSRPPLREARGRVSPTAADARRALRQRRVPRRRLLARHRVRGALLRHRRSAGAGIYLRGANNRGGRQPHSHDRRQGHPPARPVGGQPDRAQPLPRPAHRRLAVERDQGTRGRAAGHLATAAAAGT